MRTRIAIIVLAALLALPAAGRGADLYHQEVNIRASQGKDLVMVLDEVERQERFSIIKVTRTSGASVPSIMFVVKGTYEMAKLRGSDYFINLKEWTDQDGHWLYKIGFSSDRSVNPESYFGGDIDRSKTLEFLSVKDYDLLWGSK